MNREKQSYETLWHSFRAWGAILEPAQVAYLFFDHCLIAPQSRFASLHGALSFHSLGWIVRVWHRLLPTSRNCSSEISVERCRKCFVFRSFAVVLVGLPYWTSWKPQETIAALSTKNKALEDKAPCELQVAKCLRQKSSTCLGAWPISKI